MNALAELLKKKEAQILEQWLIQQKELLGRSSNLLAGNNRGTHARQVLESIVRSLQSGNSTDIRTPEWQETLDVLDSVSSDRASIGFSAAETATYLFSLKQPIFEALQADLADDPAQLASSLWTTSKLLDALGLYTIDSFQKKREEIIRRQQLEMLELSTPVVQIFDGLIALPLIGTLDSARTQVVMENLLNSIVHSGARIAILDITGVPTVDTQVAQHLLKTVSAARLMGAECIISGVRPQIAQTIVHLGVELNNVTTKATMADALKIGLQRLGYVVVRPGQQG